MSREERREQLLGIMKARRDAAQKQSEFTAELIAADAGVTPVWVYRLVGEEFKEIRSELDGPRRAPATVEAELRRVIKMLQEKVEVLEARLKAFGEDDLGAAILHIEALDVEIRLLREERNRYKQLWEEVVEVEVVPSPKLGTMKDNESSSTDMVNNRGT